MREPKKIKIGKKKLAIRSSWQKRLSRQAINYWQKNKLLILAALLLLLGGGLIFLVTQIEEEVADHSSSAKVPAEPPEEGNLNEGKFFFPYPELLPYEVTQIRPKDKKPIIMPDVSLKIFFEQEGMTTAEAQEIAFQAKYKQLLNFEAGQKLYRFELKEQPATASPDFYIYEMSYDSFAVITLHPKVKVALERLPLKRRLVNMEGVVRNALFWDTYLSERGLQKLIPQITEAFKWQIDFYHVAPNDHFKFVYHEHFHRDEPKGEPEFIAGRYQQIDGTVHYVFRYDDGSGPRFYDEEGRIVKRQFLMSPVEYDIINSPFNPERIHPIHKVRKPHYGTDYFAHLNDPVFAVGDGEVVAAATTSNNGNYVKIRHDKTHQSQYLHLNAFAEGIKRGSKIKQGQIIGYAGETGLATGVHVCFRFWVDRDQVNHTKLALFQNTQGSAPLADLEGFMAYRDSLVKAHF